MQVPERATLVTSDAEKRVSCEGLAEAETTINVDVPWNERPEWECEGMHIVVGDGDGGVVFSGQVVRLAMFRVGDVHLRRYYCR